MKRLRENTRRDDAREDAIRVAIRVRPLLSSDKDVASIVSAPDSSFIEVLCGSQLKTLQFNFCAGSSVSQSLFYANCGVRSLLQASLQGHNSTVFAYGQTGSGKTFTMSGTDEQHGVRSSKATEGLIGRCTKALYDHMRRHAGAYICRASFCEIYNEKVYDLLNYTATPLAIRFKKEKGFYVQELQVFRCDDESDIGCVIAEGHRNRRQSGHALNAHSSRSHALLTIYIRQADRPEVQEAKINFIDLAGSEKVRATGVTGSGFKEATHINTSLFTLGRVISDLSKQVERKYVTFRESALTKLLMDSLGGNAKTLMIACVAPGESHLEETMSTVEYASRAKNIVNKPVVQIDRNVRLLRQLRGEVSRLRGENELLRQQLCHHGLVPLQDDACVAAPRHSSVAPPKTAQSTQSAPESRVKSMPRSVCARGPHADIRPHYHADDHWLPAIDAHKHKHSAAIDAHKHSGDNTASPSRYTYDEEAEESYVEELLPDQDESTEDPHFAGAVVPTTTDPEDKSADASDHRSAHRNNKDHASHREAPDKWQPVSAGPAKANSKDSYLVLYQNRRKRTGP